MREKSDMTNGTLAQGVGGAAAATGGFILSLLPQIEIGLRIASLVVGLAIGIVTLVSMIKRWPNRKNRKH